MLGGVFCVVHREFSDLQCLRNTLNCILLAVAFLLLRHRLFSHKLNVPSTKDEWNKALSDYSGIVDNTP